MGLICSPDVPSKFDGALLRQHPRSIIHLNIKNIHSPMSPLTSNRSRVIAKYVYREHT